MKKGSQLKLRKFSFFVAGSMTTTPMTAHFKSFYIPDKPRGALPLTKCCFSHSLLWLRRILEGMGGGGLKKKGGTLCGLRNHRDVNPPQAANPSNTAYYIIHLFAFFKLTKYHK
jgi:hypothetical protein